MIKIAVCWGFELEGPEADIIEGFIVKDHALVSVFDELID